jgi:hypothetical protein
VFDAARGLRLCLFTTFSSQLDCFALGLLSVLSSLEKGGNQQNHYAKEDGRIRNVENRKFGNGDIIRYLTILQQPIGQVAESPTQLKREGDSQSDL